MMRYCYEVVDDDLILNNEGYIACCIYKGVQT